MHLMSLCKFFITTAVSTRSLGNDRTLLIYNDLVLKMFVFFRLLYDVFLIIHKYKEMRSHVVHYRRV